MFVKTELEVCVDCLQLIANGETNPYWTEEKTEQWLKNIAEKWPDQSGVCCGDTENYNEFSTLPCDFCGSPLAGSRYPCVELKPETTE